MSDEQYRDAYESLGRLVGSFPAGKESSPVVVKMLLEIAAAISMAVVSAPLSREVLSEMVSRTMSSWGVTHDRVPQV